jgi:hypothetical protein
MKIAQLNKTIKMGDLYKEYGASSKCMMEALQVSAEKMHPFGRSLYEAVQNKNSDDFSNAGILTSYINDAMKNTEVATVEDFRTTLDVIMQQALNDSTLSSKDTLKKPVQGVYFQRRFTSTPPWHIDALFP